MEKSPELNDYRGSCHCGLFQFTLNITPLTSVWTCNCSICSRNGYLWIHPVAENQLVIKAGEEKTLHSYEFAMRGTVHRFCPECGSSVLARRRDAALDQSLRINARMLEGVDFTKLKIRRFSGSETQPKYTPPQPPPQLTSDSPSNNPTLKEYKGNCHCGKFKFSINVPELKKVQACDCSFCIRNGYMWLFPIAEERFIVESGDGTLRSYEFGRKSMTHYFCSTCGSTVMGRRKEEGVGINVRVLKDIDLTSLELGKFPGEEIMPKYEPPVTFPKLELGDGDEGLKLYNGNCHCGAIAYSVKTKPLSEQKALSCNCSLCSRNGDLWIYPSKSSVIVDGGDKLTDYVFVSEDSLHSFCSICGVSVLVRVTDPKEDIVPINIRTINGVDLGALEFKYYDGKSAGKPYTV